MEVRDGFIVGIFNYCDRWCERCAFTSYCRVFDDHARMEASLDPRLTAVVEAPPLPEDAPPPPPEWWQTLVGEANEACREPMSRDEWERIRPRVDPRHQALVLRATDYTARTFAWFRTRSFESLGAPDDPRAVISWFQMFVTVKIKRALTVWPDEDPAENAWLSDNDGSAKIALLGIDESHAAWLALVERGIVTAVEAEPFIADLVWLGEALERARPRARTFVRPGLDEPDEVACLEGQSGMMR